MSELNSNEFSKLPNKIMIKLPSVQEFLVNSALYEEYDLNDGTTEEPNLNLSLLNHELPIDCFCIECKNNSVFKPVMDAVYQQKISRLNLAKSGLTNSPLKSLTNSIELLRFICSRVDSHELYFFIKIKENKVSKIGQSSSLADIATNRIRKYRKILGEDFYNEFKKAIGLFAHGIGVGSFVYLRRIMENFVIKPAYDVAKTDEKWDDESFQHSRMKEKIDLLKDHLPPFLVENPVIYSVISKGIHELSESECKSYFPVLRECIELILTELEAERKEAFRKKQLKKALNSINGSM